MSRLLSNAAVLMSALSLWGGQAGAVPFSRGLHAPDMIRADWQCGHGWHITSWGSCRPDRRLDYRFSSWPYRYEGYRAYDWSEDHDWRHDRNWYNDDPPRTYDWSWDD